jgi:hypothetical protein
MKTGGELTNMPPVNKRIRARLLILTATKHKDRFILAAPLLLEAAVCLLQAFVVVAVVLVFEGAEEGGRAGEEVARLAGVGEGDIAAD